MTFGMKTASLSHRLAKLLTAVVVLFASHAPYASVVIHSTRIVYPLSLIHI